MRNKKSDEVEECDICGDIPGAEFKGSGYCGNHQAHKKNGKTGKCNAPVITKADLIDNTKNVEAANSYGEYMTPVDMVNLSNIIDEHPTGTQLFWSRGKIVEAGDPDETAGWIQTHPVTGEPIYSQHPDVTNLPEGTCPGLTAQHLITVAQYSTAFAVDLKDEKVHVAYTVPLMGCMNDTRTGYLVSNAAGGMGWVAAAPTDPYLVNILEEPSRSFYPEEMLSTLKLLNKLAVIEEEQYDPQTGVMPTGCLPLIDDEGDPVGFLVDEVGGAYSFAGSLSSDDLKRYQDSLVGVVEH